MIAGQLGVLLSPADEPLESFNEPGVRAVEVELAQSSFDGKQVQSGMVAGKVPATRRVVDIAGGTIDEEDRDTNRMVASSWVADVQDGAWIVTESTHPEDDDWLPPWPFSTFQRLTGEDAAPVNVDPAAFAKRQEDADRDTVVEFVGRRTGVDDVSIDWGGEASQADALSADIGVALRTLWRGEFVRVIVYASGYVAAWEPEDWAPSAFARFVDEEILPVAYVPEDDDEAEQQTLDQAGGDEFVDEVADELESQDVDFERGGGQ